MSPGIEMRPMTLIWSGVREIWWGKQINTERRAGKRQIRRASRHTHRRKLQRRVFRVDVSSKVIAYPTRRQKYAPVPT